MQRQALQKPEFLPRGSTTASGRLPRSRELPRSTVFRVLPSFSPLPSPYFPEWGNLLGFGTCEGFSFPGGFSYWWMYLFPLLAIVLLGISLGLVCNGIERWRQFER